MLAGEPFTDRPTCVCPVIAEFLRTYNDEINDRQRRDLFPYASRAVGTRTRASTERLRANMILRWWAGRDRPKRRRMRLLLWGLAPGVVARDTEIAYRAASFAAGSKGLHGEVLGLLDDLIAVDNKKAPEPVIPEVAATDVSIGLPASCEPSRSPTSTVLTKL